jgi:uncharacterized protein YecT (DUF1311 family)
MHKVEHGIQVLLSLKKTIKIRFHMKFLSIAACVLLAASSIPIHAQQEDQEEQKCCCSTAETGQCLGIVFKKVDAELNEVYQKALKRWNKADDVKRLRKAQRAWISYRDENCTAEYGTYEGGTMASNMFGFCKIRLTRQRIREIKDIYLSEH